MRSPNGADAFALPTSSSEAVRIQINWATKNRQSMGTENFYINRVKNVAAAHSAGFNTDGEAAFTLGFEAPKPKPVVAA